jgi:hypothetical protein
MSKITYIALLALLVLISLVFLRNSLIYQPLLNHLEKRFEKKWDCEIDRKRGELSLLKGSLTLKDSHLRTPTNADSRCTLNVDEIFLQIDYSSIFSANLTVNELILDGLVFSHEQRGSNALKRDHIPPPMITQQIEKGLGKENVKRKGARVKNVVIRDGNFFFNYRTASGKVRVVTVEHVTISRRNIFLGRDLYAFFRSLLEPLGYFTHTRP